ncbi:hypothetical protein EH228_14825 [Erwinia endophytica]|uniref:hypothetical protein n=1 Tax=Erwinia endophytica TaxID=1563158 RepID=UPI001265F0DC|nr:hypothetical protein EH228_14825 [Erwinia endophytica]
MNFFTKWLKEELIIFLWGGGVVLSIIVFGVFAVSYFPDIAINLIGIFIVLIILFHVFIWRKL